MPDPQTQPLPCTARINATNNIPFHDHPNTRSNDDRYRLVSRKNHISRNRADQTRYSNSNVILYNETRRTTKKPATAGQTAYVSSSCTVRTIRKRGTNGTIISIIKTCNVCITKTKRYGNSQETDVVGVVVWSFICVVCALYVRWNC